MEEKGGVGGRGIRGSRGGVDGLYCGCICYNYFYIRNYNIIFVFYFKENWYMECLVCN